MGRSGVTLVSLILLFSLTRISGEEVELRVRPGDDVTLHGDCVWEVGFTITWFRNCSHEHQPTLVISTVNLIHSAEKSQRLMFSTFPRYASVWNESSNTHDLLLKNVSESDLGLYYCGHYKKKITHNEKALHYSDVYVYGNRTTRLSLLENLHQTTSTSSEPECGICWKLLVILCPVCALISSLLSSTCVYCVCLHRIKERFKANQRGTTKRQAQRNAQVEGGEVCYASLDIQSREQNHLKTRRVKNSDFSTYSEVKSDQV